MFEPWVQTLSPFEVLTPGSNTPENLCRVETWGAILRSDHADFLPFSFFEHSGGVGETHPWRPLLRKAAKPFFANSDGAYLLSAGIEARKSTSNRILAQNSGVQR